MKGTFAAAPTPFKDGGREVDLEAIGPVKRFLAERGIDGLFVLGTTGEGVLLSHEERLEVTKAFLAEDPGSLPVIVNCGAMTTADTVALCEATAELGVDGIAVVAPPYFKLDYLSQVAHFVAAARSCAPLPFYIYECVAVSGYAVSRSAVEEIARQAPNLRGTKVSDTPFEAVEPYVGLGIDLFVGAEALIPQAMEAGAVGSVSALAAAFPEIISDAVKNYDDSTSGRLAELRGLVESVPRHTAIKHVLKMRGVDISVDVRPPLRTMTSEEVERFEAEVARWL